MKALILFTSISALSLNAWSQCYPDRHNTSWNEAWLSCDSRLNPNTDRGEGHWIMYDLNHTYTLGAVHIWNYNVTDWVNLGMREISIDYSMDGNHWKELGEYVLERADGNSRYEGEEVANFQGDTARYVLITAHNNYGGACTGLSEVKFQVGDNVTELFTSGSNGCFQASVFPNPHVNQFKVKLQLNCDGIVEYSLYDHTGKLVLKEVQDPESSGGERILDTSTLSNGIYHLVLRQGDAIERYAVLKMRP